MVRESETAVKCSTCGRDFSVKVEYDDSVVPGWIVQARHETHGQRFQSRVLLSAETVLSRSTAESDEVLARTMQQCVREVARQTECLEFEWQTVGYRRGGLIGVVSAGESLVPTAALNGKIYVSLHTG